MPSYDIPSYLKGPRSFVRGKKKYSIILMSVMNLFMPFINVIWLEIIDLSASPE